MSWLKNSPIYIYNFIFKNSTHTSVYWKEKWNDFIEISNLWNWNTISTILIFLIEFFKSSNPSVSQAWWMDRWLFTLPCWLLKPTLAGRWGAEKHPFGAFLVILVDCTVMVSVVSLTACLTIMTIYFYWPCLPRQGYCV
jgi:hypothetical protein